MLLCFDTMVNVGLQFFLFTSVTGVCLSTPEEICVQAGELVALLCPSHTKLNATVVWTDHSHQQTRVISDMSGEEQEREGMLVHGRSLVLFSAAANLQANFSCSLRNATCQSWFSVSVCGQRIGYPAFCPAQESCTLTCPQANIPHPDTLNISSVNGIVWRKEGESLPNKGYFSSVEEKDQGDYTCTRSYLYNGHVYNRTFTIELHVQPNEPRKTEVITFPNDKDVFEVDLGSRVEINCTAVVYSADSEIFWLSDMSFVETNDSFPVFYTTNIFTQEIKVKASLVFKHVSEEDLWRIYTCKLDSPFGRSWVNITLVQKARPSVASLLVIIVCMVAVVALTVVVYVRFKVDLRLFLRDTLGWRKGASDGKSYDALLLCYNSHTDAGLTDSDRKWLQRVLEASYGYSLCLCERDVLPGGPAVEAVLDSIEKSRSVVLVPSSSDSDPGSGLLSAIHAALVEHQSQLVFIRPETSQALASDVFPEGLHHVVEAGDCVTWKGSSSRTTSSSFLKQLRYHLPAPQNPPTQTVW